MPGSCDSEQSSSPSLISSLRRFRFQNKSKPSQAPDISPHSSSSNSSNSGGQIIQSVDQPASQNNATTIYDPLSYRKYENPNDSFVLIQNIYSKIQNSLKDINTFNVLDLVLTDEESKKLKDTVLLQTSISVKWAANVTEKVVKGCPTTLLKIKGAFMRELSKYISDVLNKFSKSSRKLPENSPIKTYSRNNTSENIVSQNILSSSASEGAMDDYEEFCEKEQCLRRMLDAFPGADIMEAQDILVKCQWDLKKAMIDAQNQPLRSTRKRSLAGNFMQQLPAASDAINQQPIITAQQNQNVAKNSPEEIVLDSSDEEINGNSQRSKSNRNMPSAKRARRLISTDSEDEVAAPTTKLQVNVPYQKSQATISSLQKPNSSTQVSVSQKPSSTQSTVLQKSSSFVQSPVPLKSSSSAQLFASQKINSSGQSPVVQKPNSSGQSSAQQKLNSSVLPPALQKASSTLSAIQQKPSSSLQSTPVRIPTNQNSSSSEKTFNIPQALSIKPVTVSSPANSEKAASTSMPSLPKGLVITQVGSVDSLTRKPENEDVSVNGNHSNIPSNLNKEAQLVRIKPSGSGSISSKSSIQSLPSVTSSTVLNNSAVNKAVTISMSKGVSITPINKTVSVPKTPKALSITPVSNVKESSDRDKSVLSSTEDESSSEKKSISNNLPVKNLNNSSNNDESNDADSDLERKIKGANLGKTQYKRKRIISDEDDEEEYGNDDIYDSEDSDCEENLTSAHSAVLKFFQDSTTEELGTVPGCSKKKIEAIINLRPFTKWQDLVEKLRNDKVLSTDLLNGAKKVLDMRNAITKLMSKCQRISLDMEDLVENLKENKETSSGYVSKQPELLNERMHLTAYQMLGLNWLLVMHNQQVNAILADEMGLGKTVQAIAFLAYLKQIEEESPHLIVVPSSTLDNWKKEIETWWPSVSVICYHGQQESRRELRMQILNDEVEEFDIMLTTYNMVTSSAEDRTFFKRLEFNYVVFDEAHMLKNMASQRYANLMRIKAPRRLLLTGTPLQNNLVELMSLLIFAMPHMFSGKTEQIKQMFSCVSKGSGNKNTYEKDRIEHAKRIMKPFVLRRLKRDVLKELPKKHEETRFCAMVEDQAQKYNELIKKFSAEVQVESSEGRDPSSSGAGMMMQLRRAANHPLLLRRFYDEDKLLLMSKLMLKEPTHSQSDPNMIFEDMSVMSDFELHKLCLQYKSLKSYILPDSAILNSGKFKVLDEVLPDLIKEDHRILLFSQFTMVLDIIQDYMKIKKYKYFRLDGQTPVSERQQLIDEFNNDPEILVFLLSTKAGGLGINLTAADTVILHDIDFNPYNDKQAEDRCHRVGQVRDVRVIRLISEKTIEEGILQRAKEKLKLEKDIHDENDNEENDTASVAMLLRDALGLKPSKS